MLGWVSNGDKSIESLTVKVFVSLYMTDNIYNFV